MVKCRIPVVLIVSAADTAGVASAASVIGILHGVLAPSQTSDRKTMMALLLIARSRSQDLCRMFHCWKVFASCSGTTDASARAASGLCHLRRPAGAWCVIGSAVA